jgi:hypothetical protein
VKVAGRVLVWVFAAVAAAACTSCAGREPSPPASTRVSSAASLASPAAPSTSSDTKSARAAASVTPSPTATGYTPSLADAANDVPSWDPASCQVSQRSSTPHPCVFGVRNSPKLVVAVVGDSVVNEWISGIVAAGRPRGWQIVTELHSRCAWSATMMVNSGQSVPYTSCYDWGRAVLHDLLTTIRPDVVVTSDRPVLGTPQHLTPGQDSRTQIGDGMLPYWRTLLAHHIAVVPIRESPEMGFDVPQCLAVRTVQQCTVAADVTIAPDLPTVVATRQLDGAVQLVDMNPVICPHGSCPPVVGNIVKFRDKHHLTATYVDSITPIFTAKLLATGAFG